MRGWLRAREIGKRIQCYVCAIKLSRTGILMHFGTDEIRLCSPVSLVTQKFLFEESVEALALSMDYACRETPGDENLQGTPQRRAILQLVYQSA